MKIVLISERPAKNSHHPGYALRLKALEDWALASGASVIPMHAIENSEQLTKRQRIKRVQDFAQEVHDVASAADVILVAALGTPHVTRAFRSLAKGHSVIFDVCDGIFPSMKSAITSGSLLTTAKLTAALLTMSTLPRNAAVAYISARDADADSLWNSGMKRAIVPPPTNPALTALEPTTGAADRIVVPADLGSPHNATAFRWLVSELEAGSGVDLPKIEIYGPTPPSTPLPAGMRYAGWAERIEDVYSGNTVVFAPNRQAAGIQNKVWEALSASRRVVVGEQIARTFEYNPLVYPFLGRRDLVAALRTAARETKVTARTTLPGSLPSSSILEFV